jgi:hypothetical protein
MRYRVIVVLCLLALTAAAWTSRGVVGEPVHVSQADDITTGSLPPPKPRWAAELNSVEAAVRRTLGEVETVNPVE